MSTSIAGLHAFLFTDIEGSSVRWLNHRAAMDKAVARHDALIRRVVGEYGGKIFKAAGDAFYVSFARPADAANAAIALQRALIAEDFSAVDGIKVRMAVHFGSAEKRGKDFFGPALNRTARLLDLAHGGQILVTASAAEVIQAERDVGATFVKVGANPLDDPAQVVDVHQLVASDLPRDFPPLRRPKSHTIDGARAGSGGWRRWILAVLAAGVALAAFAAMRWARRGPGPAPAASSPVAVAPVAQEKSVAVLPFENLSKEEENAFFTNGIQDEILTNLSRIAELKVISRSSVTQYKAGAPRNLREIAPALGVAYILEGSVQRVGGKVRVTAQLIDGRTDGHVWAERYDRDLVDVFGIQTDIAEQIAAQLKARLSPAEKAALTERPTRDLAAYELYLRAQNSAGSILTLGRSREENAQSIAWLNEAVARDPNFVAAWCALAARHDMAYFSDDDRTPARLGLAQAAVDAAVRAKPEAGETQLALALHDYWGFRDYSSARRRLDLARRSLPNNAQISFFTGLIDRREGRWEESNRNLERALELDPRSQEMMMELGVNSYVRQRRFNDARRVVERLEARGVNAPAPQVMLISLEIARAADMSAMQQFLDAQFALAGSPAYAVSYEALELAMYQRDPNAAERALRSRQEGATKPVYLWGTLYPYEYFAGVIARFRNDDVAAQAGFEAARTETAALVAQQPDNSSAVSLLAVIDSQLGRHDDALRGARRACEIVPLARDALVGADLETALAEVEGRAGHMDHAVERLKRLSEIPSEINYGDLKLNPAWDPLRRDPRFQTLVDRLAPEKPER